MAFWRLAARFVLRSSIPLTGYAPLSHPGMMGGVFLFHQLDVFGLYLDGGGEVALLQVDEEALDLAAALAQQGICCVGMKIIPYFLLLFS